MPRKLILIAGLLTIAVSVIVGSGANAASRSQFKQWIAPLECTTSQIDNGVSVVTILTPLECDDLLHPKPPDGGHHGGGTIPDRSPSAPNTGSFRDPIINTIAWLMFVVLGAGMILTIRYGLMPDLLKKGFIATITNRVSSFWTRKAK